MSATEMSLLGWSCSCFFTSRTYLHVLLVLEQPLESIWRLQATEHPSLMYCRWLSRHGCKTGNETWSRNHSLVVQEKISAVACVANLSTALTFWGCSWGYSERKHIYREKEFVGSRQNWVPATWFIASSNSCKQKPPNAQLGFVSWMKVTSQSVWRKSFLFQKTYFPVSHKGPVCIAGSATSCRSGVISTLRVQG